MRHESSVTSLSWIPSEAIQGGTRLPFDVGMAHYDAPPPDEVADLAALRDADRFRFANRLAAWIQAERRGPDRRGRVHRRRHDRLDHGQDRPGQATSSRRSRCPTFARSPSYGDGWVRFTQTAGGRTGMPAPRRVRRAPFVQWQAPLAWTTLSLTIHADGSPRVQAGRREPLPAALGLRRQRPAQRQVGADRLQRLVPQVLRQGDALGSPGLRGLRHHRRDGAGAEPFAQTHGRAPSKPRIRKVKPGTALVTQGDGRFRRVPGARRRACASRSTACAWPSTGRARCSASARTSRAARARHRWSP